MDRVAVHAMAHRCSGNHRHAEDMDRTMLYKYLAGEIALRSGRIYL